MNQILRLYKLDIYLISRCYGNQSKQCTHYETLRIPETSSQKEIRDAFIKLSKELHPDIKGNESHSEYVKINEAYNILSKEHLRRVYDANIKYGHSFDPYSSYPSHPPYEARRRSSGFEYYERSSRYTADQWDEHVNSQAGDDYYGIKGIKRLRNVYVAIICISFLSIFVTVQILSINKRMVFNREMRERSIQYQREYNKLKLAAEGKSREEEIQDFKSKIAKIKSQENFRPLDGTH